MNSTPALALNRDSIESPVIEQPLDVDPQTGLFGILVRPEPVCRKTGFIFINAGLLHRVGPFRLFVDMSRRIAQSGYPSIRLDLSGKGDSDPASGVPLLDVTINNLTAAAAQLERETGVKKVVIGGLCSGADDALHAALHLDAVTGLFLFDGYTPKTARYYMLRYGPKLFSIRSWLRRLRLASLPGKRLKIGSLRNWGTRREMMERYRELVDRGVRILAAYSGWPDNSYVYPSQLTANIGHPHASKLVSEVRIQGATHLYHLSAHRQRAVENFAEWAERAFPDSAAP